jgi:hypothetical protein
MSWNLESDSTQQVRIKGKSGGALGTFWINDSPCFIIRHVCRQLFETLSNYISMIVPVPCLLPFI